MSTWQAFIGPVRSKRHPTRASALRWVSSNYPHLVASQANEHDQTFLYATATDAEQDAVPNAHGVVVRNR